jgi:casein kinase II subunit beta
MRETIEKSARHLYGLVHARYIVTTRGLAKMVWYKLPGLPNSMEVSLLTVFLAREI